MAGGLQQSPESGHELWAKQDPEKASSSHWHRGAQMNRAVLSESSVFLKPLGHSCKTPVKTPVGGGGREEGREREREKADVQT